MKFQHDFKLTGIRDFETTSMNDVCTNTDSNFNQNISISAKAGSHNCAKGSCFTFKEADNNIQIDFFKHIMRVAIFKDNSKTMPTFSVCPGDCRMPENGRPRLSDEGFERETAVFKTDSVAAATDIEQNAFSDTFSGATSGTPSKKNITTNNSVEITTTDAKITIEMHNFRMKVKTPENKLLYQDRDYIAYNFDHELGRGSMHFISREADEQIFGLGDKTGDVNKNHRHFTISTTDSMGFDARYSDPLYKQIPFYICKNSAGSYGIFYDTYSNGEMDFGVEHNNYYIPFKSARFEEDALVFYVIFGSVPQILKRFEWMCGRNMKVPLWSLKYCGSTMNYTDAPDADRQLRNFIDLCNKYGFKPGGFYLSSGYTQIGEKRYVFNWNRDKIPSPENLAAYFKKNGVEFLPNVKPAFLTDHFLYKQLAEKGWFLHYKDGTPAQFPFWSGYGSYLDFTNPEAYAFWTDCVKKELVDRGYKNIWNDNNEYDVCDEEVLAYNWGNPIPAKLIRPLFSYLMTQASLNAQLAGIAERGDDEKDTLPFSVTRSGIAGLQRISMTWTGDNNTSFEDFRYNHKMAMTMSLSGIYNFGQDIGGFAGPRPSEELFIRWIQYGIFTPRFVLHSWNPDGSSNMPWLYENRIPTVKRLFDLREKLIPYLYEQFKRSYETYEPVIYPIFLKYPDYDVESDAFFFGDDIIACPVFDEGATSVKVQLPKNEGGWILGNDYLDAKENGNDTSACKKYSGLVEIPCTIDDLPVFFCKGNFGGF